MRITNKYSFIYNLFLIFTLLIIVAPSDLYSKEKKKTVEKEKYLKLFQVNAHAEIGFVSVLDHKIKYDPGDTYLNYTKNGGQDILFFNWRISMDMVVKDVHTIIFLYQPLELLSTVGLKKDLIMDKKTFAAGTGVDMRYSFPFYRLSYQYDFFKNPKHELSLGLGIQIRNATIEFKATDGSETIAKQNIGIVPLIKLRGRYGFSNGFFLGGELDGMYAPISYLNGSDNETIGAFIDLSFRGGYTFNKHLEGFLNVRYIGGGASNEDPNNYTRNWIHLLTVTIGISGMI